MCRGNDEERPDGKLSRSKAIDRLIGAARKKRSAEVKLLLLGAGSSGKSTLLKQLRVVYANGFTPVERQQWRVKIFYSLITTMRRIIGIMGAHGLDLHDSENAEFADMIFVDYVIGPDDPFPMQYLDAFKLLWSDKSVTKTVARGDEFALPDNLPHFFDNLDRLFAKNYIPNDGDILRTRLMTRGIIETTFQLGEHTYRVFDMGGQRSERRKWIHCFEDVHCVIFLVALSGYCQSLEEDADANQMREALVLFESIVNAVWFRKSSIVLFLNKIDIFARKLQSTPITDYFPEYPDNAQDAEKVQHFFRDRFESLNRNPDKELFTHYTNSTDSDLIKLTMNSVQEDILLRNLDRLIAV